MFKFDISRKRMSIISVDANDKSRGIQLVGPSCLNIVLRGVN